MVRASTSEDVYSFDGRRVLIPKAVEANSSVEANSPVSPSVVANAAAPSFAEAQARIARRGKLNHEDGERQESVAAREDQPLRTGFGCS
jgi:hypothetical protein